MKVHQSKTMWFSLALVIVGALSDNLPALQAFIDPKVYGYTLVVIGIICAVLRFYTSKPIE
jgi:uncharacterized membrane-anchored protein